MLSLLVLFSLCSGALADSAMDSSPSVGGGSGTSYSLSGTGKITAVRAYKADNTYVTGIQLRFGRIWSDLISRQLSTALELEVRDDEHIHQPAQILFNMYPADKAEQLLILSSRFNSAGITAIAAHWRSFNVDYGNTTSSS